MAGVEVGIFTYTEGERLKMFERMGCLAGKRELSHWEFTEFGCLIAARESVIEHYKNGFKKDELWFPDDDPRVILPRSFLGYNLKISLVYGRQARLPQSVPLVDRQIRSVEFDGELGWIEEYWGFATGNSIAEDLLSPADCAQICQETYSFYLLRE